MSDIMGFLGVMFISGALAAVGEGILRWRNWSYRQRDVIMEPPILDERDSIAAFKRMNS